MDCPRCRRTLYSRRPRCEHCGETLPEEFLIPPPWEAALKEEIREIESRIAKNRAEAEKEAKEKASNFPPPPVC